MPGPALNFVTKMNEIHLERFMDECNAFCGMAHSQKVGTYVIVPVVLHAPILEFRGGG
jgi:hypothetical protein